MCIFIIDYDCETDGDCNSGKGVCKNNKCGCKPGWILHDCFGKVRIIIDYSVQFLKKVVCKSNKA